MPKLTKTNAVFALLSILIAESNGNPHQVIAIQLNPQERTFRNWDKNRDGVLLRSEVPKGLRRMFGRVGRNQDGKVMLAEHMAATSGKKSAPSSVGSWELKRHVIRQVWNQEPRGFDQEFFVRMPSNAEQRWPITFLFHGNGGNARPTIGQWPRLLQGHLVVSPQGYQNNWNILDEKSRAPDLEYFKSMVAEIKQKYFKADLSNISLIGFSNGAGYIFRLLIELNETVAIKNAVPMVSSMVTEQYHQDSFWNRSEDSTVIYGQKATPVGTRNILTIHGTADRIVPCKGGMRGRNARHLSAQDTAYA